MAHPKIRLIIKNTCSTLGPDLRLRGLLARSTSLRGRWRWALAWIKGPSAGSVLMTTRRSAPSSDCQHTPVVPRTDCLASLSRPCRSKPALASRILKPRSSKMEWQYEEALSGDHRWLFHRMVGETVKHPSIDPLLVYPPVNVFIESCTELGNRGLSVRYSCRRDAAGIETWCVGYNEHRS